MKQIDRMWNTMGHTRKTYLCHHLENRIKLALWAANTAAPGSLCGHGQY